MSVTELPAGCWVRLRDPHRGFTLTRVVRCWPAGTPFQVEGADGGGVLCRSGNGQRAVLPAAKLIRCPPPSPAGPGEPEAAHGRAA